MTYIMHLFGKKEKEKNEEEKSNEGNRENLTLYYPLAQYMFSSI